jgi:hypothetical protein
MEREKKGILSAVLGSVLFVLSLFIVMPMESLYLHSLTLMFVAVVMIGIGTAVAKGFDRSLDIRSSNCYYCDGKGMIETDSGTETCPRCGGTGKSPEDE